MQQPLENLERVDRTIVEVMSDVAIPLLRGALGITYLWFGGLKLAGVSPISELVGKMSFGLPRGGFVRLMGVWEVALGLGLLFRVALRFTLLLYFLQLGGTFLVFFAHPSETFRRGNPLILTERGEFIVKNLVLFAAGITLGATARHGREDIPTREPRAETEPKTETAEYPRVNV